LLICDAATGAPLVHAAVPDVRALHVSDDRVWVVAHGSAGHAAARLYGWRVLALRAPAPFRLISLPPTVRELRGTADAGAWLWTEKTLIAVAPTALTAFCLP